ncbi:hypothetical protein QTG56_25685 (plasmid) [Rossellomorea sp. AcN35-11]|nr:hypothetical protein [Rossellomorea aquimaris]WJV32008.1 hypothetical protein QTG56_25685 [Rossellomorea sp. AcN35-11]
MPYNESETKGKIREVMNSSEPILDGMTDKTISYEIQPNHYQWLLEQAQKVDSLEKENVRLTKGIKTAIDFRGWGIDSMLEALKMALKKE